MLIALPELDIAIFEGFPIDIRDQARLLVEKGYSVYGPVGKNNLPAWINPDGSITIAPKSATIYAPEGKKT